MNNANLERFDQITNELSLGELGGEMDQQACGGFCKTSWQHFTKPKQGLMGSCVFDKVQPVELFGKSCDELLSIPSMSDKPDVDGPRSH